MPRLDGFRVLHRIRAEPESQDTPVVMLTGHASPEDVGLASHLGADCYLTKPVPLDDVAVITRRLIESRAASNSVAEGAGSLAA